MSLTLIMRLTMLSAAMLYVAVVLAGLSGFDSAVMLAFGGLFVMWNILLRPTLWPDTPAGWADAAVLRHLATIAGIGIVVVALCMFFGHMIGSLTGFDARAASMFPPPLTLGLGLGAVLFARVIQPPAEKLAEMEEFIEKARAEIEATMSPAADAGPEVAGENEAGNEPAAQELPEAETETTEEIDEADHAPEPFDPESAIENVIETLRAMHPGEIRHKEIAELLDPLEPHPFETLAAFERIESRHPPLLYAQMQFALREPVAAALLGQGPVRRAVQRVFDADIPQLAGFAARYALNIIEEVPGITSEMPDADAVSAQADKLRRKHKALAQDLRELRERLEAGSDA